MFAALEENQVQLSTMKASRFVKAFEQEVDRWERTLSHILEVVEMLLTVQRQWMYLEVGHQPLARFVLCSSESFPPQTIYRSLHHYLQCPPKVLEQNKCFLTISKNVLILNALYKQYGSRSGPTKRLA